MEEPNKTHCFERRRVVEPTARAEGLSHSSGEDCGRLLDLRNILTETRYDFASLLWIECEHCKELNSVPEQCIRYSFATVY